MKNFIIFYKFKKNKRRYFSIRFLKVSSLNIYLALEQAISIIENVENIIEIKEIE